MSFGTEMSWPEPEEFTAADPLGIAVNDIAALNRMPEQRFLRTGFVDITKPPFNADASGRHDSTRAIQDAVSFGRHHKLAVWFPLGTYIVNDTISCPGGWSDERTATSKYLPYTEVWPCVLIGERHSGEHPRIKLAPNSPGFADPLSPKRVLDFFARSCVRTAPNAPLERDVPQTGFNQLLYGIDVHIGSGNPGAVAVSFANAEGSTIQDCILQAGNGYAGLLGAPGSGGGIFNLTIHGGQFGALMNCSEPSATLVGCRFDGQSDAAIHYQQRSCLTLVGCEFKLAKHAVAVRTRCDPMFLFLLPGHALHPFASVALIDCRIDRGSAGEDTPVIDADSGAYLRNTWVRASGPLVSSTQNGHVALASPGRWNHVAEVASSFDYPECTSSIFINGTKSRGVFRSIVVGGEPPADLRTRHLLWEEASFPAWNSPGVVNVKDAPYFAKGDGESDDYAVLQSALDEHDTVFLPKGAYRISQTLRLRPRTRIIGISPAYSMICPVSVQDGDFNDLTNPQPALRTADTSKASTQLAFFSVFLPREDVRAAYVIDWACGDRSFLRCICPITGYTRNDLDPLSAGIRPWSNWRWEQVSSFTEAMNSVEHVTPSLEIPYDTLQAENDTRECPNWPLIHVRGHGGGGFYPFFALDGRLHGPGQRRILVERTSGPLAIYHAHLQYCCGQAEMEIRDARNIAVFGTKNEGLSTLLHISNAEHVLIIGYGGPGRTPEQGKIILKGSENVDLVNLVNDDDATWAKSTRQAKSTREYSLVRVRSKRGEVSESGPDEKPTLFKIEKRNYLSSA